MKAIDELIESYKFYGDERVSSKTVLKDLETLKEKLKEQHKETFKQYQLFCMRKSNGLTPSNGVINDFLNHQQTHEKK